MKKHLLAVAVAAAVAAPAFAQNVSISGRIGAVVNQEKFTGIGKNQRTVEDPNSRVIFSVSEDLGGGLKFTGQFDIRGNADETNSGDNSSGNTFGAISGAFGRVLVGKNDMFYNEIFALGAGDVTDADNTYRNILLYQPSSTTASTSIGIGRVQNLVRFDTPTFAGFNASVGYSQNAGGVELAQTAANAAQGGANVGIVRYASGPVKAHASTFRRKDDNSNIQLSAKLYGVEYAIGNGFTAALNVSNTNYQAGVATKLSKNAYTIPVAYTSGANTFVFTYGEAADTTNLVNSGAKLTQLTYHHALSKRTTLGVSWVSIASETGAAYGMYGATVANATAGSDGTNLAVGIRHNF